MIDLRSDTVTRPTDAMRRAMAEAEVGDDVFGDDPTVNRLQDRAAEMLGTEAALLVPSGTQGNLVSLLTHCGRGDEYVVGQDAHTYKYEGGGAAVLGGIQPQPLESGPDGTLDLERVGALIKPRDPHFARTKIVCLENTCHGRPLPMAYLRQYAAFCRDHGLGRHLDGARVFNAAVALGVGATDIARHFDTVSFCLSKGLGAPVGSVVCGPRAFIEEARRWRKVTGGGMRQAGVIAAAGLVALDEHVDRLAEDHANAERLAAGLAMIDELELLDQQTNMVFVRLREGHDTGLASHLADHGVRIVEDDPLRLVTHLDVSRGDVDTAVEAFKTFFEFRGQ
ncbi:MAG: low-specificity L-threonine aldolase [Halofilum sp. (in: g-proteobacteria)]|nr:low-specificity L-threonine aldolase [Halofilum sp. (in: g-proteobacteria)]